MINLGSWEFHPCWLSLQPHLMLSLLIFESQTYHWSVPTLPIYFTFSDLGFPCLFLLQLPGKHPALNSQQSFMPCLGMYGYSISPPYPVGDAWIFEGIRWGWLYDSLSLPMIIVWWPHLKWVIWNCLLPETQISNGSKFSALIISELSRGLC